MTEVEAAWERVKAWLQANAPPVLNSLNPPATEAQIAEAESALGVALPEDVRAFYRLHDGQKEARPGAISPQILGIGEMLPLEDVVAQWRIWKELLDGGEFEGGSEPDAGVKSDWWNARWIPLTYDGSGNHDCIDLDPAEDGTEGQIITMWHDDSDRPLVAPSFAAWLAALANDLETGKVVYSEDGNGLYAADDV